MLPQLLWVISLALPLPLLVNYFINLWNVDQYQFFVVLLTAVAAMYYLRWNREFTKPTKKLHIALLGLGWLATITASLLYSPWLGYFGFLLTLTSFSLVHWEKKSDEGHEPISKGSLFYLMIPLWLALRVPLNLDQNLTIGLQHWTAATSSFLLDRLSINHQVSGVVFDLASGKLFVEEACSGIQSLFALLCVALLLLAWNRRPIVLVPVYALAAIFSAALLNVVRVVSIAAAQEWYSVDLARGWKHELLGYGCLGLAILLLASFDRLFRVCFFPISDDMNPMAEQRLANPFKVLWNKLLSPISDASLKRKVPLNSASLPVWQWPALIIMGVLCWGCQVVFATQNAFRERGVTVEGPVGGTELFWEPGKDLFSTQTTLVLEGFQSFRNGEDFSGGQNTDVWMVLDKSTKLRHRIAISQPYDGFHDLCICYAGNGWRIGERQVLREDTPAVSLGSWSMIYSNWFNDNGTYAYLTFSGLNRENTPALVPEETVSDILANRFSFGRVLGGQSKECLMFQVWTTLDSPLTREDQDRLKQLHTQLREHVRSEYAKKLSSAK